MVVVDLAKLILYVLLGVLAWFGEAPWWSAPVLLLYDLRWPKAFILPWKRKQFERQYEEYQRQMGQRFLQQIDDSRGGHA